MPDAISLGVGEPDFVTPWHIRDAGIYSLEKGHTYYTSNSGLANLREEICNYLDRRFNLKYNYRRKVIYEAFNQMGLKCFEPLGAFYVFPSIKSTGMDSNTFCETLLKEQKVAVVPGDAFGQSGEGYVRCSYAYSIEAINRALDRIDKFVYSHR